MAAAPVPGEGADRVLGERLPLAIAYAELLATTGVDHGLIGPREVERLWERHILNCAVVQELIPLGCNVIDVGSGAGLPGIPLAIARPDLQVTLVEPLQRRVTWLTAALERLDMDNLRVRRGKAQVFAGEISAPVVTARAVARLASLGEWCLPLVEPGGRLLALKGSSAQEELDADAKALARKGATEWRVTTCGGDIVSPPTVVVEVLR